MKKLFFISMTVAGIMMLGSCGGKQKAQVDESQEAEKTDISAFRDQTIYG